MVMFLESGAVALFCRHPFFFLFFSFLFLLPGINTWPLALVLKAHLSRAHLWQSGSLGPLQMSFSREQQHEPHHMDRGADHVHATAPDVGVLLPSPRGLQLIADSAQAERETPRGAHPRARSEASESAQARARSHLHPYETAHPPPPGERAY